MDQPIKSVEFLDLSGKPKIKIKSIPPTSSDNKEIVQGSKVCVQNQRAEDLKFYIVLEVMGQSKGHFVGKIVGQEGYEGPRETIYPGEYFMFEFDGLFSDDQVWFDEKNVAYVF